MLQFMELPQPQHPPPPPPPHPPPSLTISNELVDDLMIGSDGRKRWLKLVGYTKTHEPVTFHTDHDTIEEVDECYKLYATDPEDAGGEIRRIVIRLTNGACGSGGDGIASSMKVTESTIDREDLPDDMKPVPSGRFQILPPPDYYSPGVLNQDSDFDIMAFDLVEQREHTLVRGRDYGDEYYPSAGVEFDDAPFLSDDDS